MFVSCPHVAWLFEQSRSSLTRPVTGCDDSLVSLSLHFGLVPHTLARKFSIVIVTTAHGIESTRSNAHLDVATPLSLV